MDKPPILLRRCESCDKEIAANASLCPECGYGTKPKSGWTAAAVLVPIIFIALPCAGIGTCALVTGPLSRAPIDHYLDFINYAVAVFAFLFCFAIVRKSNQIRKRKAKEDEHVE